MSDLWPEIARQTANDVSLQVLKRKLTRFVIKTWYNTMQPKLYKSWTVLTWSSTYTYIPQTIPKPQTTTVLRWKCTIGIKSSSQSQTTILYYNCFSFTEQAISSFVLKYFFGSTMASLICFNPWFMRWSLLVESVWSFVFSTLRLLVLFYLASLLLPQILCMINATQVTLLWE